MTDTLYVHLYGPPGTGKSTTRALVFGTLKQRGHNVEESPEFAKDLTWEERHRALGFQPYIFGKQAYREERLNGQVDAVISDTSTLLSLIFKPEPEPSWYSDFTKFVLAHYKSRRTLNILLERDPTRPYNPAGRWQTEEQALALENDIADLLLYTGLEYQPIQVNKSTNLHVEDIVGLIEERL